MKNSSSLESKIWQWTIHKPPLGPTTFLNWDLSAPLPPPPQHWFRTGTPWKTSVKSIMFHLTSRLLQIVIGCWALYYLSFVPQVLHRFLPQFVHTQPLKDPNPLWIRQYFWSLEDNAHGKVLLYEGCFKPSVYLKASHPPTHLGPGYST